MSDGSHTTACWQTCRLVAPHKVGSDNRWMAELIRGRTAGRRGAHVAVPALPRRSWPFAADAGSKLGLHSVLEGFTAGMRVRVGTRCQHSSVHASHCPCAGEAVEVARPSSGTGTGDRTTPPHPSLACGCRSSGAIAAASSFPASHTGLHRRRQHATCCSVDGGQRDSKLFPKLGHQGKRMRGGRPL